MSDGNFSFSDALLTQAMSSYGNGGGCGTGGQWFGSGCCVPGAPYADMATIQHGLCCNRDLYQVGNRAVLDNQETIQRSNGTDRICDKLGEQNNVMGQNMLQLSGVMADGRAESAAGFSSVLLELCKCCKDGQILTIQESCKTRELVREENGKTRELLQATRIRDLENQNNVNATVGPIVDAINNLKTVIAHH